MQEKEEISAGLSALMYVHVTLVSFSTEQTHRALFEALGSQW